MKLKIYTIIAITTLSASVGYANPHSTSSSSLSIINNGEIDLLINDINLPAWSPDNKPHTIPIAHNNHIKITIAIPGQPHKIKKIKIAPQDIDTTIKIGGFYNATKGTYDVYTLKSNNIPTSISIPALEGSNPYTHQL